MCLEKKLWIVSLAFILCCGTSCGTKPEKEKADEKKKVSLEESVTAKEKDPTILPLRYQTPGFVASDLDAEADLGDTDEEYQLKVGATIKSTGGPQPLWDVLKRLANLKGMTVSWASDVNQNTQVDVDISANDNFFDAVENLLRQADYFHEVHGKTIVVRYKDTKIYKIGVPATKGKYNTTVGGNFLNSRSATGSNMLDTEGTVKITSDQNDFDVWDNIKLNLDIILEVWSARRELDTTGDVDISEDTKKELRTHTQDIKQEAKESVKGDGDKDSTGSATVTKGKASSAYYTIDKNVGLISVTAPRPLLEKVDLYISSLKKEIYRQVLIEAKIIEVYLQDNSKIGLDWSSVLKDFQISGTTFFGTAGSGGDGQVYPWVEAEGDADSVTRFISKLTLNTVDFSVLLNALNEQGDSHVLANPKITVLNGQPALISVGKDLAYIKTVTKDVDTDTNEITYTSEVDNVVEGIALGVMATVIDDNHVILHLTPITTDLIGDEIEYRTFGDEGLEVGLPQIGIRQMSTMVEVENGEMLVIGGLIDSVESKTGDFAPVVGSIPVIKYLFGVEEKVLQKRELVILLTPKII